MHDLTNVGPTLTQLVSNIFITLTSDNTCPISVKCQSIQLTCVSHGHVSQTIVFLLIREERKFLYAIHFETWTLSCEKIYTLIYNLFFVIKV